MIIIGVIQTAIEICLGAFIAKILCQAFRMQKLAQFIELLALVIIAVMIFGEFSKLADIFDKLDKIFK